MIVERLTPVGWLLTLKKWEERTTLNVRRHLCTCCLEEGWCIVDVLYHLPNNAMLTTWEINQQWCAERLLIHETLVEPSMLAHVETLVRGVDNHCVLKESMLAKILNDTTHVAVNRMDHTHIVVHIALILPFSESLT